MVALGYGLRWQPDWLLALIYLVLAGGVLALFLRRASGPSPAVRPVVIQGEAEAECAAGANRAAPLSSWPTPLLAVAVAGFLLLSIFLPQAVSREIGAVAGGLLVALLAGWALLPRMAPFWIRIGLYLGSTFVLYLGELGAGEATQWAVRSVDVFLIGVAGLVMIVMRLGASRRFETTPLDSLMILLALALPFLPALQVGDINVSVLTAKLIVLFFAFELLLHAYAGHAALAGLVVVWVLGGVAARAWW